MALKIKLWWVCSKRHNSGETKLMAMSNSYMYTIVKYASLCGECFCCRQSCVPYLCTCQYYQNAGRGARKLNETFKIHGIKFSA